MIGVSAFEGSEGHCTEDFDNFHRLSWNVMRFFFTSHSREENVACERRSYSRLDDGTMFLFLNSLRAQDENELCLASITMNRIDVEYQSRSPNFLKNEIVLLVHKQSRS